MKRLRQLCAATVLTILLINVASADEGIMHPAYAPPPPPPPPTASAGIMHPALTTEEVIARSEEPTIDMTTEMALFLIQNMLALF